MAYALRCTAIGWCVVCVICCDRPHAHAGAFTLAQGEGKVFLAGIASSGDKYFDRKAKRRSRGDYVKRDLQVYGEYGLWPGVTLLGSTSLQRIEAQDGDRSDRKGLGRSEFGARIRLTERDDWTVSAQGSTILAGAKRSEGLAAIGESDDQFDARVLAAHKFSAFGKPTFVDLQAGYRVRTGDPADEMRFDATLGVRVMPQMQVLLQNFNTVGIAAWKGPYRLKQRIPKLQAAVLYDLNDRLVLLGSAFVTPWAQDALDERGGQLGAGFRF